MKGRGKEMKLEVLQAEMIAALKAKDKFRKDVLSGLVGAVKKAGIDNQCRENIPETLVDTVLIKEQKTMQEMIDTCPAERADTLAAYQAKMEVIKEFAPQLMTNPEEIKVKVLALLESAGIAPEKKNKGAAMKILMPQFKGKADMSIVNKVVSEVLA